MDQIILIVVDGLFDTPDFLVLVDVVPVSIFLPDYFKIIENIDVVLCSCLF
jgi:hypothetical protein